MCGLPQQWETNPTSARPRVIAVELCQHRLRDSLSTPKHLVPFELEAAVARFFIARSRSLRIISRKSRAVEAISSSSSCVVLVDLGAVLAVQVEPGVEAADADRAEAQNKHSQPGKENNAARMCAWLSHRRARDK